MIARECGVKVVMGTDVGTPGNHAGDNMQEVEVMVNEAGFSPAEAIRSATLTGAELLGIEADLGGLEEGKIADIIACPQNPVDDISALRDVFFVMKEGQIYRNDREFPMRG
jgi:imidazolonepropionase-like amidohydrolase